MDVRQGHAFWEVLSQQSVGLFIRASLPGASRVAELDLDVGRKREAFVIGHLAAAVPGQ
jgi:hypothetical protein